MCATTADNSRMALGPALVIGGCGFVGFHIVNAMLKDSTWGPVSVINRNPEVNRCEGASYYTGDICNFSKVQELLEIIRPRIIFHTAAPRANDPAVTPSEHQKINVEGTKIILSCAKNCPTVNALVYTSTSIVLKDRQHFNLDENAPLWEQTSNALPYFKSKALADTLVREANSSIDQQGKGLLTAALRLSFVYGERDSQFIPSMLKLAQSGRTKIQLGNNKNLVDPVYVGNAATAHLLLGENLLNSASGSLDPIVDGEAFNITDGDPLPFWTFSRMIWRTAGDKTTSDQIRIIPGWLAQSVAQGIDWAFYLCTLGRLRPPLSISPLYIQYTIDNSIYDISKARERLGYAPITDREGYIRSSISWELENYPEKYKMLLMSRRADSDRRSMAMAQT